MTANHFTIGELATLFGQPEWQIRRAVDSLDVAIPLPVVIDSSLGTC